MAAHEPEVDTPSLEALLRRQEVEALLFEEARLLDQRAFSAWLDLFAADAIYWIPAGPSDTDPLRDVSIVFDRVPQLRERVWRLESGLAYAQEPNSKTSHLVGNVEVHAEDDELVVRSTFTVAEFRRERHLVHAGSCLHRLRRDADRLMITLKKVALINSDGHIGNMSILL